MSGLRRSSRQSTPTSPPPSSNNKQLPSISSSLSAPSSARRSASTTRPQLPTHASNRLMDKWSGKLHKVKVQTLQLGGNEGGEETITIARVKCPVPKGIPGHIIKRFDTNSVSASSLFRAAFPTATDQEESLEMSWISRGSKGRYGDTKDAGAEGDESRKLSGTWIPSSFAPALAEEYSITRFAHDLIHFTQDKKDEKVDKVEKKSKKEVETLVIPESDTESLAARSPRPKRARVTSPSISKSPLSPSSHEVSILQTLTTDTLTGVITETTEVTIDDITTVSGLVASEEIINQQIEESKKLVEALKASSSSSTSSVSEVEVESKKRVLEEEEEDIPLPTSGTLADLIEPDSRGFFGKIFKKKRSTVGRVIKNPGSQVALVEKTEAVKGRRWVAGLGLAVAVGATAAAPYFFG